MHNLQIGRRALITTDSWFVAPNGSSYRAVFGTIRAVKTAEETLGIKTNAKSTNWYVEIGNMTLAGCQIHYGITTDECNLGFSQDWSSPTETNPDAKVYMRPSLIYNAGD